jgi:hypothetical protein
VWCGGAEPWADEPLGRMDDAGDRRPTTAGGGSDVSRLSAVGL